MAFSTTWDLEKYKSEFESEEHWQLRKKFMETHKNQFPEERLVCLARAFYNIEFLGCRYPEETMKLVSELSKGVADDYREKQKGKLKRTFVQASDAAGAKIKGRGATPPSKITEGPPNKIAKSVDDSPSASGFNYSCFVHESLVKPALQNEGDFPGFIIYEGCKTNYCPINILTQSAHKNKKWNVIEFEFPIEKNSLPDKRYCEVTLNKKFLASAVGQTNKHAKFEAAKESLNKLRQTCYTIQEKLSFFTDREMVRKEKLEKSKAHTPPVVLPQDNIGSKMMMKMGWAGTGLGKNQQGIQAPIEANQTMRRAGFGHMNTSEFNVKFRNIFKDYIDSTSTNDLVFAPDFSNEERRILHQLAKSMKLKTKSHGKNENRQLVVYKILTLNDILHNLLLCGGENEKYLVLYPQGDDSSKAEASNNNEELKKENPSVSVRTVPADFAKEKATLPTPELISKPQNLSQIIEESVEKTSVLKTECLYEDPISVNAPGMVVLSSDDDAGPKHDQDDTKHKPLSSEALQLAKTLNVEESDIDVVNRVFNMKKDELQEAIETYNYYVRQIHGGEQLKKADRKKYNACKRLILDLGGIIRPEINQVKCFNLEALLLHVDSIKNTSSLEESSDKPSNSQGFKARQKAFLEKRCLKTQNKFNYERKGLQILNQNPELIPEHLKIVVRALKEAERIRSDDIRLLRRRLKKCVAAIGAGKDLEKDFLQDIYKRCLQANK